MHVDFFRDTCHLHGYGDVDPVNKQRGEQIELCSPLSSKV